MDRQRKQSPGRTQRDYVIGESLDESVSPHSGKLTVWDVTGDSGTWTQTRKTSRYGTDFYDMDVCGDRLAFSVTDKSKSPTTYKTYQWDISDSNPDNWGGTSGSPISNLEKSYYGPNCNFLVGKQGDSDLKGKIYKANDLSLYKENTFSGSAATSFKLSPNVKSDSEP